MNFNFVETHVFTKLDISLHMYFSFASLVDFLGPEIRPSKNKNMFLVRVFEKKMKMRDFLFFIFYFSKWPPSEIFINQCVFSITWILTNKIDTNDVHRGTEAVF